MISSSCEVLRGVIMLRLQQYCLVSWLALACALPHHVAIGQTPEGNRQLVTTSTTQSTQPVRPEHDAALIDALIQRRQKDALMLLQRGASPTARDRQGKSTALYYAVGQRDALPLVTALIERGADVNARCHGGMTALMQACSLGSPEVVKALLDAGADPNLQAEGGASALHMCAFDRDRKRVNGAKKAQLLIDRGAKLDVKLQDGQTPLDFASAKDQAEIVKTLNRSNKRASPIKNE